jgi:hypothetical protein
LAKLDDFLQTADDLERQFAGSPLSTSSMGGGSRSKPPPRRGTLGAKTIAVAADILEIYGPMPTRDLVPHIEARDIEVGGKSKIATLSARLSAGRDVLELRDGKWHRKTDMRTSGASAPQEGEAADRTAEGRSAASYWDQAEEGGTHNAATLT